MLKSIYKLQNDNNKSNKRRFHGSGVVVRLLISPGGTTSGRGAAAKAAVEKRES